MDAPVSAFILGRVNDCNIEVTVLLGATEVSMLLFDIKVVFNKASIRRNIVDLSAPLIFHFCGIGKQFLLLPPIWSLKLDSFLCPDLVFSQ